MKVRRKMPNIWMKNDILLTMLQSGVFPGCLQKNALPAMCVVCIHMNDLSRNSL